MASAAELQAKVSGAAAALPGKKKLQARSLAKPEDDYLKIMGFGEPGTGKTEAIWGFLDAGLKVFVASTDFGGNGLRTIKEKARKLGREELLKSLSYFDFADYNQFAAFVEDPGIIEVDGQSLYDWAPDLISWDGGSNWQVNMLDEKVLDLAPGTKNSSEARLEGLRAEQQDWDSIKRGTFRTVNDFLQLHNKKTGQRWHKYVTFYEMDTTGKEEGKPGKRMAYVAGGAKNFLAGGFDLVIRMVKVSKLDGKEEFKYICSTTTKDAAKNRGLNVATEEPADMKALWQKITNGGAK